MVKSLNNRGLGRFILPSFFSLICCQIFSQNKVLNPSFEEHITPCSGSIATVNSWSRPTMGSPDWFSLCNGEENTYDTLFSYPVNFFGSQTPRNGEAYTGICVYHSLL
ncbi:MAG: hypothetical protein KKA07_12165, partial [Bacteroidetes bacterium]|nr:hypothetical protein [Bacteroidota bacterium]